MSIARWWRRSAMRSWIVSAAATVMPATRAAPTTVIATLATPVITTMATSIVAATVAGRWRRLSAVVVAAGGPSWWWRRLSPCRVRWGWRPAYSLRRWVVGTIPIPALVAATMLATRVAVLTPWCRLLRPLNLEPRVLVTHIYGMLPLPPGVLRELHEVVEGRIFGQHRL